MAWFARLTVNYLHLESATSDPVREKAREYRSIVIVVVGAIPSALNQRMVVVVWLCLF